MGDEAKLLRANANRPLRAPSGPTNTKIIQTRPIRRKIIHPRLRSPDQEQSTENDNASPGEGEGGGIEPPGGKKANRRAATTA